MEDLLSELRPLWSALERENGLPSGYLDRTAKIESSYNPDAQNPNSSAGGLFQFINSTARQYGLTDKFDPIAASKAAAQLAADNAAALRRGLGRDPTAGELYLAHQQGSGGALKLLRSGDAPAADLVGGAAARLNGGGGLTGSGFASKWTSKFADLDGAASEPPATAEVVPSTFGRAPGGMAFRSPMADGILASLEAPGRNMRPDPPTRVASARPTPAPAPFVPSSAMSYAAAPVRGDVPSAFNSPQPSGASPMAQPVINPAVGRDSNDPASAPTAAGGGGWLDNIDWDRVMEAAALIDNAIPRGVQAKGIGEVMAPFAAARARRADRAAQQARDERDFNWRQTESNRAQSNADRLYQMQLDAQRRADAAEARNAAKPLIQEFKDDAGNRVYKQYDMNTRQWVPLIDGGGGAQPSPPTALPPAAPLDLEGPLPAPVIPPPQSQAPVAPMSAIPAAPPGANREAWARKMTEDAAAAASSAAPEVKVVKQPDGSEVAVQWDRASKSFVPLKAPEGGNAVKAPTKLTEQQSKDIGFYNRGAGALKILDPIDTELTSGFQNALSQVPLGNYVNSEAFQKANQAGREFLSVILRKDTGAAVTPGEVTLYGGMYLPQPGDKPAVIEQKRAARMRALEGVRSGLGTAEILAVSRPEAIAQPPAQAAPPQESPPPAKPGVERVTVDGVTYERQGKGWKRIRE